MTPGTAPGTDVSPTKRRIPLSNWKDAGFTMSDKEIGEVNQAGILLGQASEALKALVNEVDTSILNLFTELYSYVGVSGTTPDGVDDIVNARKNLNSQLAPTGDRSTMSFTRTVAWLRR